MPTAKPHQQSALKNKQTQQNQAKALPPSMVGFAKTAAKYY
jgi:hypothetical protein